MKRLIFLVAFAAAPLAAQTMMDTSTIDLGIAQIGAQNFLAQSIDRDMALGDAARRGGSNRPGSARRAPAASSPTTFAPVAPSIAPAKLALLRKPAERALAQRFFQRVLDDYHGILRRKGAPAHDVARAASFFVSNLLYVDAGRDLPEAHQVALRRRMHDVFARDPAFARQSARQRQELYEEYIINGAMLGDDFDRARQEGDTRRAAELRSVARRAFTEIFGAPPDRARFTAAGMTIER